MGKIVGGIIILVGISTILFKNHMTGADLNLVMSMLVINLGFLILILDTLLS